MKYICETSGEIGMRKILLIWLLLLPYTAYADKFSAEFRYWIQRPTPDIQANTKEFGAYTANEPLELSEAPDVEFKFNVNKSQTLKANFAWLSYEYNKRESRMVKLFLVGADIKAELMLSRFSLGWQYNILNLKHIEFGPLLDMKFAWLKYNLTACNFSIYGVPAGALIPEVSEEDEIVIFLPSPGIHMSIKVFRGVKINLEFSGSYVGSYSGIDFGTFLSVPVFKYVALTGGYKLMYITLSHKKIEGDLLSHGATIGMKLNF